MRFFSLICCCVLIAGCASTAEKPTAATAPDDQPYRFESEGQVPPPDAGAMRNEVDRVDVFEETPVAEGAFAVEAVDAVETEVLVEDVAADSAATTAAGFRVQVFATGDRHRAEQFVREAEARLNTPAYIEHVDDIYKVRVGDCRSREEAERLRLKCQAMGYRDAWIVTTEVRLAKPVPETPAREEE
jgi:cell division septation protein DedD